MSILLAASAFISYGVIPVKNCKAYDADTMRCEGVAVPIRLAGIDAPPLGRCVGFRQCVPGDGKKARDEYRAMLLRGNVAVQQVQIAEPKCSNQWSERRKVIMKQTKMKFLDCYGRGIYVVMIDNKVAQCELLDRGLAAYRWDQTVSGKPVIGRLCGKAVQNGIKF
jgi:endonuclease YncB( thermonuclease family)